MMSNINVSIRFSVSQLENLVKLFDNHFVEALRSGEDAKDMEYVCDMCEVYNKLKKSYTKSTEPSSADEPTDDK